MTKRSGVKGLIETGTGSPLEVHPWEDVDFTDQGIFVYHHDLYETVTFLPLYTVRMVRLHEAEREKMGRNIEGRALAQRNRQPPVKFSEIVELHRELDAASTADSEQGECDDGDDDEKPDGVHDR